jgi:hypothetical protein
MSSKKTTFQIKKIMKRKEKTVHVLILDSNSEVFETKSQKEAEKMCQIFNSNTDSGWFYEVIEVKSI